MKLQGLSVKRLFFYVIIGLILSMTVAAAIVRPRVASCFDTNIGKETCSLYLRSMRDLR